MYTIDLCMLTLNLSYEVILMRFGMVFCCLDSGAGVRMLDFSKDWWKFIQIHNITALSIFLIWKMPSPPQLLY